MAKKTPKLVMPKKVDLKRSDHEKVVLGESRRENLKSNVEDFETTTDFLNDLNAFNAKTTVDLMEMTLPGSSKLRQNLTDRATELADDPFNVPQSVRDLMQTEAAQRGISSGVNLGSDAGEFDLVEAFGREGIAMGHQNLNQAQNILQSNVSAGAPPSPVNPFQFFSGTQQQQNANQTFETQRQAAEQRFNEQTQQIDQSFENAKAAMTNKQNAIDAEAANSKTGIGQIVGMGVGAVAGAYMGNPMLGAQLGGAIGGGVDNM